MRLLLLLLACLALGAPSVSAGTMTSTTVKGFPICTTFESLSQFILATNHVNPKVVQHLLSENTCFIPREGARVSYIRVGKHRTVKVRIQDGHNVRVGWGLVKGFRGFSSQD